MGRVAKRSRTFRTLRPFCIGRNNFKRLLNCRLRQSLRSYIEERGLSLFGYYISILRSPPQVSQLINQHPQGPGTISPSSSSTTTSMSPAASIRLSRVICISSLVTLARSVLAGHSGGLEVWLRLRLHELLWLRSQLRLTLILVIWI